VLTGIRPTFARFKTFNDWADKSVPNHLSLPRYLKESGYTTISVGKVYHHQTDDLDGWTEEPIWAKTDGLKQDFITPESKEIIKNLSKDGKESNGPAFEMADCHDTAYIDGKTTLIAVDKLKQLKKGGKPFFLGLATLNHTSHLMHPKSIGICMITMLLSWPTIPITHKICPKAIFITRPNCGHAIQRGAIRQPFARRLLADVKAWLLCLCKLYRCPDWDINRSSQRT
jgi:iduronate 2-sulfatase